MKKMSRSSGRSTRYPGMSTRNSGMSTRWTGCFQQELIERLWVALLSEAGTSEEAEKEGGDIGKDDSEEESSDTEETSSTEDEDDDEDDEDEDERGLIDDSVYQELIGAYGFSNLEDDSFKMPDSNTLFMMSKIRMDDNEKSDTEESDAKKKVGLTSTRHPRPTKTTSARQAMVQARVKQGQQQRGQNQPASSRAKPLERPQRSSSNSPHFSGSRTRQSRTEIPTSSHKMNTSSYQPSSTKTALLNSDLADSKENLSSCKPSSTFSPSRRRLGKSGNQQLSRPNDSSNEGKRKGPKRSTPQMSPSCGNSIPARSTQRTRTPHFSGSRPMNKTNRSTEDSKPVTKARPDISPSSAKDSDGTQEPVIEDVSLCVSSKVVSKEENSRCSSDCGRPNDPSQSHTCKSPQPDIPSCSSQANSSKRSEIVNSPRCSPQALLSPEGPLQPERPDSSLQSEVPKDSLRPETPLSPVSSVSSPSPNQELVSKVLVIPPLAGGINGESTKTSEDVEEEGGRRADRIETCMEEALVQVLESLPQGWAQVPDHTAELVCSLTAVLEGLPRPLHAIAKVVSAVLRIHGRNPCLKGEIPALNNAHVMLYVGVKLCSKWGLTDNPQHVTPLLEAINKCEGSLERLLMCVLLGAKAPGRGCGWYTETEEEQEKVRDLTFLLQYVRCSTCTSVGRLVSEPLWVCGSSPLVLAALAESPGLVLSLLQHGACSRLTLAQHYSKCYTDGCYLAVVYLMKKLLQHWNPTEDEEIEEDDDLVKRTQHLPAGRCLKYILSAVPIVPPKFVRGHVTNSFRDSTTLLPRRRCLDAPELRHLARCAVRHLLKTQDILPHGVAQLDMPQRLKAYVNLHEL